MKADINSPVGWLAESRAESRADSRADSLAESLIELFIDVSFLMVSSFLSLNV